VAASLKSKTLLRLLPTILVFCVLVISLLMLNLAMHNPAHLDEIDPWLTPLYLSLVSLLTILIVYNLIKAMQQLRERTAGARFTIRLLTGFIILTLIPVMIVTYFSLRFIGDRIDSYFDANIETALEDSVELSERSLALSQQQNLRKLQNIAVALSEVKRWKLPYFLEKQRQRLNAHELVLLDEKKVIVAASIASSKQLIPHFPAKGLFDALRYKEGLYQLEPIGRNHNFSRVAVKLQSTEDGSSAILTALIPINDYVELLTQSVEAARNEYKSFNHQRESIKRSFRFVLLVILIITVLFSVWAAFVFSRRLTQPVRTLVEGTMAVASGNLNKKLPVTDKDDFSLLARSFNTMTTHLYDARREREISQQQVQRQHDYLNAVMEHITSSVITLDADRVIRRVNSACQTILGIAPHSYMGKTFKDVCNDSKELRPLFEAIALYLGQKSKEWQCDVTLQKESGHRQILICKGAVIMTNQQQPQGYVLVIDEVTELIQAEHDAAWSEVARRLAHEIKNPLTPIQLSAERIAYKLVPILDEQSATFVKRMTSTISNQVKNMQGMVNAFSEYARAPALNFRKAQLNDLLLEIGELYRVNAQHAELKIETALLPTINLDTNRFRQLLVNLVKNALEALPEDRQGIVSLRTERDEHEIVLTIADNGLGIAEELLPQLFEPYVTNKAKGTGLGLAIVKKITEEHSGTIRAENRPDSGACFIIRLPMD
jgi:PAS domain S-box-containing protein